MLSEEMLALIFILLTSSFVSLIVSFIILAITVNGLRERLVLRAPNAFFEKLLNCNFCLSFWISTIISFTGWFILHDIDWLVIPFTATPLTRLFE